MTHSPHFLIVETSSERIRSYGELLYKKHGITGDRMLVFNKPRWYPNRTDIAVHLVECSDSRDILLLNTDILAPHENSLTDLRAVHPGVYIIGTRRLMFPHHTEYLTRNVVDAAVIHDTADELSYLIDIQLKALELQP